MLSRYEILRKKLDFTNSGKLKVGKLSFEIPAQVILLLATLEEVQKQKLGRYGVCDMHQKYVDPIIFLCMQIDIYSDIDR